MNKIAAIYTRVSTDEQAERGYSLPSQIEECENFAEQAGYTIAHTFIEDHSGVTPIADRPEGAQLIELTRHRDIDAVIVYQVDRLSREIVDLLATVQTWLRSGINVYALDIGKIDSELDIMLVIKGWQGSDERRKIVERTRRGKWAKAKAGKIVAARAPYGYRFVRSAQGQIETLEPVDERAEIVKLIYKWYVQGDETGKKLSAFQIAKKLYAMGIASPGEYDNYKIRKAAPAVWSPNTIIFIIGNEAYAGTWLYGARVGTNGKKLRPRSEWIRIPIPPIIEPDIWEAAQEQRKQNQELAKRNRKNDYLLAGRIRCACGYSMTGSITGEYK